MKPKNLHKTILVTFAVPLFFALTGCNDRNNSSSETASTPAASAPDTNGAGVNADNTGKNVRDRNDNTLTPGDQGNSDADRQITQKIRQTIVSGTNDYSMTAKNVKIITTNGKVTLRGPVNNDSEKTGIETIAKNVAGDGNVDNQLEIKATQ